MNILLLTPLYKIVGRESLERNTEAIHYLIKYWNTHENVKVRVINTYLNPGRNFTFLLKKGEFNNYVNDYEYNADGVDVYLTEIQQIPFQKKFWWFQTNKIENAIKNVINTGFCPDIIIMHFPTRYLEIKDCFPVGIPKVAVMHFTDVRLIKKQIERIDKINSKFDYVFCRSKSIFEECRKLKIRNLSDHIISSGVPEIKCHRKDKLSFLQRKIKLLFVGKLIDRKHADYVIKALYELKDKYDFEFNIIGKGNEENNLRKLVVQLGLEDRVYFLGNISRENVFELMSQSHVFIMPSIQETLGLVYLEAMCCGCITIGTEKEGIDGIIIDGVNGFLVKNNNAKNVSEKLNYVFNLSDSELELLSRNAIETGRYYNERDMSNKYLNEIIKIVQEDSCNQ